jgi:uncharacterized membrane protein YcaP (DUF421 family)
MESIIRSIAVHAFLFLIFRIAGKALVNPTRESTGLDTLNIELRISIKNYQGHQHRVQR